MKKAALIAFLALVLPGTALAKGPSAAMIAGPGLTTIRVTGSEGSSTPFWRLVEATGWFEAAWGPSRLPQEAPQGVLGPRYTITWKVPSSSRLHQDVYPYAKPSPVTYMPRGQEIYGTPVKGGWYTGGTKLAKTLAAVGAPAQPPPAPLASPTAARATSGSGPSAVEIAGIVLGAVILVLVLGLGIRARRKSVVAPPAS